MRATPGPRRPGLCRRLAAVFYDTLLLFSVLFLVTACLLPLTEGRAFGPNDFFYSAVLVLTGFLFFAWFWTHGGQTPGMRAWRIEVRTLADKPLGFKQALLRFLAAIASWAFFGFGFLWILADREKRAWHDLLSGTRVVRAEEPSQNGTRRRH